jgi:2'-5' RNA ligase
MRVFVGLALPTPLTTRLGLLKGGLPGARWVRPENMHVTLHFLGEVEGRRLDDVDLALSSVMAEPFSLKLAGSGEFGGAKGPRVVWAGLAPSPALEQLHGRVAGALARFGVETEARRFVPHVTLAWLRDTPYERVADFVTHHALLASEPWQVSAMHLYSSHAGREGHDYRIEASYAFAAGLMDDAWDDDDNTEAEDWR